VIPVSEPYLLFNNHRRVCTLRAFTTDRPLLLISPCSTADDVAQFMFETLIKHHTLKIKFRVLFFLSAIKISP
jgi:hypothetical protein